jgi:hypothetical protein
MHKTRVRTLRMSLSWAATERKRGEYAWPDQLVALLAEDGIRPTFMVFGTPKWATGTGQQNVPPLKGKAKKGWKKFLGAAVRHYGSHGSFWRHNPELNKKAVKSWQIWNEPNLAKYFGQKKKGKPKPVKHAPKAYAKLVKTSDKAVSKADKHAKVVLAGLSVQNSLGKSPKGMPADRFLKSFLGVHKIAKHFDAVALHPYAPSFKPFKKAIKKARKTMKAHGAGSKGLWLTEFGWGSGPPDKFHLNKGKKGQAKLLNKSFKLVVKKRNAWNIGHVFWFDWRDPSPGADVNCSFCSSAGLLNFNRTPKPSFVHFKHFTAMQRDGGHHHGG